MAVDGAEIHYLSELRCYIEPLHQIQFRQKMKELKAQLDADMKFTEELHKKGLLGFYLKEKFKQ